MMHVKKRSTLFNTFVWMASKRRGKRQSGERRTLKLLLPCHICFINIKLLIALLLKTFALLKNEAGLPYIVSNTEYKAIYDCF